MPITHEFLSWFLCAYGWTLFSNYCGIKVDDIWGFHNNTFFFETVYFAQIEKHNLENLSVYRFPVVMEMQTIENLLEKISHVPSLWESLCL